MESPPLAPPKPNPVIGALSHLIASYLRGFINLASMSPWLRRIAVAGFVMLGIVAAALAISQLPQPVAPSSLLANGQATETTVLELLVYVIAGILGVSCALAGALQMRWLPRTAVGIVILLILGASPLLDLAGDISIGSTQGLSIAVSLLQIVLLVGILIWASISIRLRRSRVRAHAGDGPKPADERFLADFFAALALVLIYFGLYLFKWGAWLVADPGGAQGSTQLIIYDVTYPAVFFPVIGSIFIYWFTASSLDWALSLASGAAALARRLGWLLPVGAGIIAIAELVAGLINIKASPVPPLIVTGIFGASVVLVLLLGPPIREWPGTVPLGAAVAGVLAVFGVFDLPIVVTGYLGVAAHLSTSVTNSLLGILTITNVLVAIIAGLALAALGRIRRTGGLAAAGLMVLLAALSDFIAGISTTQANLGIYLPEQPKHIITSLEMLAALAILGCLVWLAVTRQPLFRWASTVTGPIIAVVGVQAVDWYAQVLQNFDSSAPSGVLAIAGIFLVLNVWGLLRSGTGGTNGDSPAAPRAGRVLLYFGYTLVTAAVFLYATGLRVAGTGAPVQATLAAGDTTLVTIVGLYVLCVPLALVTGLGRSQSWLAAQQQEPGMPERLVHRVRERLALALVLAVGVLLLAGFLIFATDFLLPLAASK
jgi:hypothetical protein